VRLHDKRGGGECDDAQGGLGLCWPDKLSKKLDIRYMSCILYIMSNKQDTLLEVEVRGGSRLCGGEREKKSERECMSFEEKSVWVQLLATAIALIAYLLIAANMLASGVREMAAFGALFIVATIFLVVLLVAGFVVAALSGRQEASDERDRLIAWRAEYNSSWLLATGVLGAIVCMLLGVENAWTANVLIALLFAAEMIGFALRIVYYRKGM
jgi:hypothetical protein